MRYLFAIIVAFILSSSLDAQVHVNINIGSQPVWGPTGYDYVEYYYLPDIDVYYYVPLHRFYYYEGRRWIYRSFLSSRFGHFDLYNSYKVVVNERDPWRNHDNYRQKYGSYKGRHDQQPIRDSRDSKYFVNPKHPQHNTWAQQQKQNKGNVKSVGNSRGNIQSKGNNIGNVQNRGDVKNRGNNMGNVQSRGNVQSKGTSIGNVRSKGNSNNKGSKGNDKGKGK